MFDEDHSLNDRQRRAFRVLFLSCVVFGLAAAAFAWTTIRVHDRQVTAEKKTQTMAAILAAPDTRSATDHVRGGGKVTAYYSPALGKAAIVGHGLPVPANDHTYELWYVDDAGSARRPAGTSRFDAPQNTLVLASASPLGSHLELTMEPADGSSRPTSPTLLTLDLG